MSRYLFTSESVTEGHPDKMCDAISDAVLDALLERDPQSRVACETVCKTGFIMLAGEITTRATVDLGKIAREAVREIGYDSSEKGFDWATCGVLVAIEPQSPDISQGVTEGEGLHKEQGAGDQGLMFGYACSETPELMPAPIMYAHRLAEQLTQVRKSGKLPYLRPDGKTQVTVEYDGERPVRIETVVVSSQHSPDVTLEELTEDIVEHVIREALPPKMLDEKTKYFVNPTGRFVIGGPCGDAGLTGRKIIVDTYGGMGHHGGGAFSGKDPSKVDRSAAYYARYIAKNVVAAKLARRCEVQIAYAIGVAQPVGVHVSTFGTGTLPDQDLDRLIMAEFDMRPKAIIQQLDLLRPCFRPTSAYGHFGRPGFTWEKTDRVRALKAGAAKLASGQGLDAPAAPTAESKPRAEGSRGRKAAPPSADTAAAPAPKGARGALEQAGRARAGVPDPGPAKGATKDAGAPRGRAASQRGAAPPAPSRSPAPRTPAAPPRKQAASPTALPAPKKQQPRAKR